MQPAPTPTIAETAALQAELTNLRDRLAAAELELERTRAERAELNRIGLALMTERDLSRLLAEILVQARRLTCSDAGSVYLVEEGGGGSPVLRFRLAQNDTLAELQLEEFTLPLDCTSLAGQAAVTRRPLLLDDAYALPPGASFAFNGAFDERNGYRTRSLLAVPLLDRREQVVGVLQLINRKRQPGARIRTAADAASAVLPYGDGEVELVRSLAGQAAVAIENSRLYARIEQIFESFVRAAVTAIDQRDPATAGHSVRVAELTCGMAEVLNTLEDGPYAGTRFSAAELRELRYAALLHDFGKVAVREAVLLKERRLPPVLEERVRGRLRVLRAAATAAHQRARAGILEAAPRAGAGGVEGRLEAADAEHRRRLAELERIAALVDAAGGPAPTTPERAAELREIAGRSWEGPDGEAIAALEPEELEYLMIPRGTLSEDERREIESHVVRTHAFLQGIPWTEELARVPELAYGHHERLAGGGYPRGVAADHIPVATRLMSIADVFDALTAADRPYKRAMPLERALAILQEDAGAGALDPELVRVFIASRVYERVLGRDWRTL
jgi:HD-GYP domain-containing protein (c-di-GMP phosphodiesterase class II)